MMTTASSSKDQPSPDHVLDYERAIEHYDDVDSMYKLAYLLARGAEGIKPDPTRAVILYRRAIEEGSHLQSMLNLAALYHSGYHNIPADLTAAVLLYKRAIDEHDDPVAMCKCALITLEDTDRSVVDEETALDLLQRSADRGCPSAMSELGLMHHVGWGSFPKDLTRAASLFSQAIELGHVTSSMYYLAWLLLDGYDDVPADPTSAVQLLQRAIDEGNDTDAMVFLAKIFREGHADIKPDWQRAANLLQRAIDSGHSSALFHLATLYLGTSEENSPKDIPKAVQLLQRAIDENNDHHAIFKLGVLKKQGYNDGNEHVPPNPKLAADLFKRAIKEGNSLHAMLELSLLLRTGADGVAKDEEEAKNLIKQIDGQIQSGSENANFDAANLLIYAAEHGDTFAEMLLGIHYKFGDEPFEMDKKKAAELLQHAADAGNSDAMFHLGMIFMDGHVDDIECDMAKAIELFRKAADEHGNLSASNVLSIVYLEEYHDVEKNISKAVHYMEKAIQQGDTQSMNRLGMLHLQGRVLPSGKDIPKAIELFRRGMEEGDDVNAMYNMAILVRDGIGVAGKKEDIPYARSILQEALTKRRHFRVMIALADMLLLQADKEVLSGLSNATKGKQTEIESCAGNYSMAAQLVEEAIELDDLEGITLQNILRKYDFQNQLESDSNNEAHVVDSNKIDDKHSNDYETRTASIPTDKDGDDDGNEGFYEEEEESDVESEDSEDDLRERAMMFREAILTDAYPTALYSLGRLVQDSQADLGLCGDSRAASRWFQRAIQRSNEHRPSKIALARLLITGDDFVPQDISRAKLLLKQAARRGDSEASAILKTLPL